MKNNENENLIHLDGSVVPKVPKNLFSWIMCECGCGLTTTYKYCPSCGKRLDWDSYHSDFEKRYGKEKK